MSDMWWYWREVKPRTFQPRAVVTSYIAVEKRWREAMNISKCRRRESTTFIDGIKAKSEGIVISNERADGMVG